MNVSLLCNYYHPRVSGAITVIDTLVRNLSDKINFTVFYAEDNKHRLSDTDSDAKGCRVHKIISHALVPVLGKYFPFTSLALGRLNKIQKTEILHCHTLWPNSIIPLIRLSSAKIPKVLTLHGGIDLMKKNRWGKTYEDLVKKALLSSNRIVVFDEFEKEELDGFCSGLPVEVIPNGIDVSLENNNDVITHPVFERIEKKTTMVLFVGTLNKRKGIHDLIKVARVFSKERGQSVVFVLVGDVGPDVDLTNVPDNIYLVGPVKNHQLCAFYRRAHMLVLPSYSEGMPMVILEAMAHALPVIATQVGAVPSLVQDDRTGFLVCPGDNHALRNRILYLRDNPDKRKSMGDIGKDEFRKKFTGRAMATKYYSLYQALLCNE